MIVKFSSIYCNLIKKIQTILTVNKYITSSMILFGKEKTISFFQKIG